MAGPARCFHCEASLPASDLRLVRCDSCGRLTPPVVHHHRLLAGATPLAITAVVGILALVAVIAAVLLVRA